MKKSTRETPLLLAQAGSLVGQKWTLVREMTIGRDKDCDIQIPDRQVSRFHLRITPHDNKSISVRDLESKNGTYLNGRKITGTTVLKDGDQLKIALAQNFIYISSESTLPLAKMKKTSGRLLVDAKARRAWVLDKEVIPAFSVQQFRLLLSLYERIGEVVPREKIITDVWGNANSLGITEQAMDALVRRLRERLKIFDKNHEYLVTVRGYGIRLDNPEYREKKSG